MRSVDLDSVPRQPVDGSGLSAAFVAGEARNRWAACYHEAGHAVFAYEVGWWVNYEGIDVEQQYTGLGCREIDYTPWRRIWVHLAGPLAEYRFLGSAPIPGDQDLAFVLAAVRAGRSRTGDEGEVLRALVEQFPDETDCSVLEKYRLYGQEIWCEMIQNERLWRRVMIVAEALYENGRLRADDVETVLRLA